MMRPEGLLDVLAALLSTPARSGIYLTRSEIVLLTRLPEASLRMGERRRMLAALLKSPGSTEELAALIEALRDFCRSRLEDPA